MRCIYCSIAAGELPASIVYEDETMVAFLEIQPVNPGHVVVVPKRHAESLVDLSAEDAAHMMEVGQLMDKALRRSELRCEGVNLFIADGPAAGQDVPHIQLHVFPRFEGNKFELRMDSSLKKPPRKEQLMDYAAKLQEGVGKV